MRVAAEGAAFAPAKRPAAMAIDARNLSQASLAYQQLKRLLIENEGLVDGGKPTCRCSRSRRDGLQDLCVAACAVKQIDADVAALEMIIADKQARKQRFADRRAAIAPAIAEAMLDAGLKDRRPDADDFGGHQQGLRHHR